jgi:hypothetical protein
MIAHALEAFVFALISFVVICASAVVQPRRATCPTGWSVEGVRPSGRTQCRPVPPAHCGEPVPPDNKPCPRDERAIRLEIYCTNGQQPIVVNERTVGCQQSH